MLNREEISELLIIHSKAYELLLWLANEVSWRPDLLPPAEAQLLQKGDTAVQWFQSNREQLPESFSSMVTNAAFANIFASFFSTSFKLKHFEFEDRLLESSVKVEQSKTSFARSGAAHCQLLAVKHLIASEKIYLTDEETQKLARRKTLAEPLKLWTYVWELDRRSKGKGKGQVVHALWRSISPETRKMLDANMVWTARQEIIATAREYRDAQQ